MRKREAKAPPPPERIAFSDELTRDQRKALKDYITVLGTEAKAAGEPREEQIERDGISWYARCSATGELNTLVVEHTGRVLHVGEEPLTMNTPEGKAIVLEVLGPSQLVYGLGNIGRPLVGEIEPGSEFTFGEPGWVASDGTGSKIRLDVREIQS